MKSIDSPSALFARLTEMFPAFAEEFAGEEIDRYHQVLQRLTPVITGFLEASSEQTLRDFCDLVNSLVAAGGERENAISTCLLEHASQVNVRSLIEPHLSDEAKVELR